MILLLIPTQYEFSVLQFIMPESLQGKVVIQSPGMGKMRTLACLYETREKFGKLDWVLLAGYCGSLDGKYLPMGTRVEGKTFFEGDFDAGELEPPQKRYLQLIENFLMPLDAIEKTAFFISQDKFLMKNPYTEEISEQTATDMESIAVAKFCTAFNIPYSVVKVVTDVVGENSEQHFKKEALNLANAMNEQITLALLAIQEKIK